MPKGVYNRDTEAVRVGRASMAEKMKATMTGRTAATHPYIARMAEKLKGRTAENDPSVARMAEKLRGRTAETDPGVARRAEKLKGHIYLRAYPYEGAPQDEYSRRREACFERKGSRSCSCCGMTQEEHLEKYSYIRKNGTLVQRGLCFHHLDPLTKLFDISHGIMWTRKIWLEQLLLEVDKCQLLCISCHRKLHHEIKRQLKLLSKK